MRWCPAIDGGALRRADFADIDGDALCDEWEVFGFDADRSGTDDADLSNRGADPSTKDVFVECQWTSSLTM